MDGKYNVRYNMSLEICEKYFLNFAEFSVAHNCKSAQLPSNV